jgi:hypothetical protein
MNLSKWRIIVKSGRREKQTNDIEYTAPPEIEGPDVIAKALLVGKICMNCKHAVYREYPITDPETKKIIRTIIWKCYCQMSDRYDDRHPVEPYDSCEHFNPIP